MSSKHMFDDMAKMASGAASTMMDMGKELERMVQGQCEHLMQKMNLVTREEFDAVKVMAEKARTENEALKERLEKLEK